LPPPRPTEQPLHPTPQDNAPAEQSKPNPAIDQACLDRLGDALITFEAVTLPLPANPRCAIETPVRLKAVMSSTGRGPILLPDGPTVSCHLVKGSAIGCAISSLLSFLGSSRSNSSRFAQGRGTNAAIATAPRTARSAHTPRVSPSTSEASNSRMAEWSQSRPRGRAYAGHGRCNPRCCMWLVHNGARTGSDEAHTDHMHVDILQHGSSDRFRICQ